jgi:3'-phosphoadenosine 5'-phosphosulfate sulfotransferase (PAPS reductase)/FAD synthetase
MSKLKEEIDKLIRGDEVALPIRVSLALLPIKNARLEYILDKLNSSKQSFIGDILDAALYDIEMELGLRNTEVNVLHNDNSYRHPITEEYAEAVTKIMDAKEKQLKEFEEKTKPKPIKKIKKSEEQ